MIVQKLTIYNKTLNTYTKLEVAILDITSKLGVYNTAMGSRLRGWSFGIDLETLKPPLSKHSHNSPTTSNAYCNLNF